MIFSDGITSANHGWLAGALVTDGHFNCGGNRVDFRLRLDDYQMVCNVATITKSNGRITFDISSTGSACVYIRLHSEKMIDDLMKMFPCDWHHKCFTLESSVQLFDDSNTRYVPSYILGVSDGDGSIGFQTTRGSIVWSINSKSLPFLRGIRELINQHCCGYDLIPDPYLDLHSTYSIQIMQQKSC